VQGWLLNKWWVFILIHLRWKPHPKPSRNKAERKLPEAEVFAPATLYCTSLILFTVKDFE
jgi:hypothetical protein